MPSICSWQFASDRFVLLNMFDVETLESFWAGKFRQVLPRASLVPKKTGNLSKGVSYNYDIGWVMVHGGSKNARCRSSADLVQANSRPNNRKDFECKSMVYPVHKNSAGIAQDWSWKLHETLITTIVLLERWIRPGSSS